MILFLQIPITDIRRFVGEDTGRLPLPLWPAPEPHDEFMRSFGVIKRRESGGIKGWVGENEVCNASHALRLSQPLESEDMLFPADNGSFHLKCVARYFYFDGLAVAEFQIVFISSPGAVAVSAVPLTNCLTKLLNLQVAIPQSEKRRVESALLSSGKYLAAHYLHSSTRNSHLSGINPKWAVAGDPFLWIEAGLKDEIVPPNDASTILQLATHGMELSHWRLPVHNKEFNIWCANILNDSAHSGQVSRTMRMLLMRLHSEHVSLRDVLKSIETEVISSKQSAQTETSSSNLQYYMNEATRRISGLDRSATQYFEPEGVGMAARKSLDKIDPGRSDALLQKLQFLRSQPQGSKKLEETIFAGDIYNIHGSPVNVGPGSHVDKLILTQTWNELGAQVDLSKLAEELTELQVKMAKMAKGPEENAATSVVTAAVNAAKNNNGANVLGYLKIAGGWALEIAKDMGVKIASSVIERAMGL